jgi:hypothetical protein
MPTMFAGGLENNTVKVVSPLDATGSTDWIDCSGLMAPMSVTIDGVGASDAIEVRVWNSNKKPSSNYNGILYGAAVTAAGVVKITEPYRWIRINRSTAGGSPLIVNAFLAGARGPAA